MADDSDYVKLIEELQENLRMSESEEEKENNGNENDESRNKYFEIVTGYKVGSKLVWVPSENCFYKQNTYSKTYDGMAYTCYDDECTARKVLPNNGTELITLASAHVPHLPMRKMYKERHYLNLMKDLCRTEPHTVSVSQIFYRVQAM